MKRGAAAPALLLAVVMIACGCGCLEKTDAPAGENRFSAEGTVIFVPQAAGYYGIVADDGNRYYPVNLPDACKVHGQRVRFSAVFRSGDPTLQQWGTPVEIIAIERLPDTVAPGTENVTAPGAGTGTPEIVTIFGRIETDGGAWCIAADDGRRYFPVNLDDEFRREGLTVIMEGEIAAGVPEHPACGIPVVILDIADVAKE